jgi:hypothetical protein
MVVSYDLLYELEAVLLRPWFRSKLAFSDVLEYVIWLRERGLFVADPPPVEDLEVNTDVWPEKLVGGVPRSDRSWVPVSL